MTTTLTNVAKDLEYHKVAVAEELKSHKARMKALESAIVELEGRERVLLADIDLGRIDNAKEWVDVYGCINDFVRGRDYGMAQNNGARLVVVEDVVTDLVVNNGKLLRFQTYGVKSYSDFGDQRCYGRPRHGHIVFGVSLKKKAEGWDGPKFYGDHYPGDQVPTGSDLDDVLYYLKNLSKVQEAEKAAA